MSSAWKTEQERKYRRATLIEALNEFWKRKNEYLDERDAERKEALGKTATIQAVAGNYGIVPATLRAFKHSDVAEEQVNSKWRTKL
jgi:hypothetical protein